MKLATGILLLGMLGTAGAQNPSIIDTTKAKLNAVQQQKTADSNAALSAAQGQGASLQPAAAAAKPAAGKPVSADNIASPAFQAASRDRLSHGRAQNAAQGQD